jgi:6-phosphogluconolactonase
VENLHPFPTGEAIGNGRGPEWCAATLADELRAAPLEQVDGWPAFDLMLMGIGGDGHVLSVFPGSPAFDSPELAMAIPAPTHIEPHIERVTLNPAVIGAARKVLVVAYGSDKAAVVATILGPERDPRRWPAQLALGDGATWILDEAAAASLPR